MGGDVGVYAHGQNALEMKLMVEYGMKPIDVLKAATSVNAKAFHLDQELGYLKPGYLSDIIIVKGNPAENIENTSNVVWVMKDGKVYKN